MTTLETEKKEWTTPVVELLDKAQDSKNGPAMGADGMGLS